MTNINVLLLASEITKGMKSIGPKCLLKLTSDLSVLDYQISKIKCSIKSPTINIVTGFESERVRKYIELKHKNINIICDDNYIQYNQTNALLTALDALPSVDNLLVISSGILMKNYPKIKTNQISTVFYLDQPKDNFDLGSINNKDNQYLFYGLPNAWSECVYFDKTAIEKVKTLEKKKHAQLYLFEVINSLMESSVAFESCIIPKKNIFKVVSHKDIVKAKRFSLS